MAEPYRASPFGSPDGARSDLTAGSGFISFDDERAWGALATRPNDRRARIFVGRKGSGKTLFLRQMQAAAPRDGLYTVPIHDIPPATELVVGFCRRYSSEGELIEKWTRLWRCAIFRSLVSHLLRGKDISNRVPATIRDALSSRFNELLRDFTTPVNITSQAEELLQLLGSTHEMNRFLLNPQWEDLRAYIVQALKSLPPVMLFVDAIDDAFDRAPWFWLRCQQGLLGAVLQLLDDGELANQFHLVIALRDVVFASSKDSEHGVRYADNNYFRVLTWDKPAIDYFVVQKLKALDKSFFRGQLDSEGKTVATWLGIREIWNPKFKQNEPIDRYLLRHTRMLPRDVVMLGNNLCQALSNKLITTHEEAVAVVRREVSRAAEHFGTEQLRICTNEIVSQMIPHGMVGVDQYSAYLENPALTKDVSGDVAELIRLIGHNRFDFKQLEDAQSLWRSLLKSKHDDESGADLFEVLWRNQLLGYRTLGDPTAPDVFFSDHTPGIHLPPRQEYLFHPVVTDTLKVNGVGERPVVPFW